MKHNIYLKVGPVVYDICSERECSVRDEYRQFVYRDMSEVEKLGYCRKIYCQIKVVDRFSNIEGNLIYENPERMVFVCGEREYRLYAGVKGVCGIYREPEGKEDCIEIELLRAEIPELEINLVFLEMLALERFLLKENALVLHSSYIIWKKEGIVFTAPSGTGKSTQAELWHRYEGAEIVNGDRSVLWWNPLEKRFDVCGLPFCGSSGINRNLSAPLRAVVFLEQAPENHAESCPAPDCIRKMFGEMSINQWNPRAVQKSLELIGKVAEETAMVSLKCNMELEAVETLKRFIEKRCASL